MDTAAAATFGPPPSFPNGRPLVVISVESKWDQIVTSFTLDHELQDKYAEAIGELKEEARKMLTKGKEKTMSERLVLIDTLERLGIGYHFDQEIEDQLEYILSEFESQNGKGYDLFTTALWFRLLRQHRHYAKCDVFYKFMDQDKRFKQTLSGDAKGLLSLYEAAHLRIHGEQILEEAVTFTVHHLKRMVQELEPPLQDRVNQALERPFHRGLPRMETRRFISSYEKDDSRNQHLLKLAKLDFNYVQNVYKIELQQITRWWKELNPQLPYARNRVVMSYLWAVSFHFEPHYSYARVAGSKIFQILTILDDTYDNYVTVEEALLFTKLIERWNIDEIDQLTGYLKLTYRCILKFYEDYEREAATQGILFAVPYAKQTVKELCRAHTQGLKYIMGGHMGSFEDYIENSVITSIIYATYPLTFLGLKSASKETIDWLMTQPAIIRASAMVGRYLDDLGSYQRESQQGTLLTGLDFYVKHHGGSMQEARDKFGELAEDAWISFNTEWVTKVKNVVPKEVASLLLGYARASDVFFRNDRDGFAKDDGMAPEVEALFMGPIIIV